MTRRKRKLTAAEKAEKKRRREMYMTVFMNGKMKRVRRPQMVEGLPAEEFIRRNALEGVLKILPWMEYEKMLDYYFVESSSVGDPAYPAALSSEIWGVG